VSLHPLIEKVVRARVSRWLEVLMFAVLSRERKTAIATAMTQAALFVLIYNACLMITVGRQDLARLYAPWELQIPLVPAMVIPYLSIYLLFFVAFFLCRDAVELRTLSQRLSVSQLVAGACYLLFPLECGFQRPAIDGMCGVMFRLIDATDRPYNLAPSLHVTTAIIVGSVFVSRTRGAVRILVATWFVLIAASTLFTWQHHLVDVVGGAMLGLACLRVVARKPAARDAIGPRTRRAHPPSTIFPVS
jgi:membrane-associated phospholipid phosphatase